MVLAEIGNCARFSLCLGGTIMALSGKTKRGITLAIAVIAGLASLLLAVLLLVLAMLLIAWGQAPERTEAFVGRLPYGSRNVSTTHMGIYASRGSYWGHIGISPLFSVSEV
jgi:hypothetical protein